MARTPIVEHLRIARTVPSNYYTLGEPMAASDLTRKRELRTRFMRWLYDTTGGSEDQLARPGEFQAAQEAAGDPVTADELRDTIRYLEGEHLLRPHRTLGGIPSVQIEHSGVVEVEQAMSQPERPTEHFVPIVNITNVQGDVIGSQIQQGSPWASQSGTISVNQAEQVRTFITAARDAANLPELDSDDRTKVLGDLEFMEKELSKREPRWDRLRAVGESVKTILLSGLGQALGKGITALPWYEAINSFA